MLLVRICNCLNVATERCRGKECSSVLLLSSAPCSRPELRSVSSQEHVEGVRDQGIGTQSKAQIPFSTNCGESMIQSSFVFKMESSALLKIRCSRRVSDFARVSAARFEVFVIKAEQITNVELTGWTVG